MYLPFLSPGRYDILIRGSDYHGNWTPDPIIVPIEVGRFYYQQVWFYFLIFFVLAGAVLAWMLRQRALRKKLETELAGRTREIMETRDQLIIQEKLASLGQMVAGIAHEIKNPLNFVHNFSEGSLEILEELITGLQKPSNAVNTTNNSTILANLELLKQNLEFINQNGNRVNEIVSSMMHHARNSSGEQLMVDINRLIDSNITLAYHSFRATHPGFQANIIKDLAKPSPAIMAFPNELGRCLINLFDNACSAVLQKSLSGLNGYEPSIQVSTTAHTGRVEIRISDNGSGIPPHILDKIFTPFFTTKPTRKGNIGLGLSICHDIIVQQHKGQLCVESEEGEFTELVILLPDTTAS